VMAASDFDIAVIGAGVVGLAAAAELARAGRSVVILEERGAIAQETTSRNSEVIHAGIYYPKDSLKAELCGRGRDALYRRCESLAIPHKRIGKLIVATRDDELPDLEALLENAHANGVPEIHQIDRSDLRKLEPAVTGVAALHSPITGIVDAHALSLSYLAEAEEHDAILLVHHEVDNLEFVGGLWRVLVRAGPNREEQSLYCRGVVNAAGLASDRIAEAAGIDVDARGYRLRLCKGDYFSMQPGAPIELNHLIYPVGSAASAGLGIHSTSDLAGRIRFGPDAEYVDGCDYAIDPSKADHFARGIRRYLPQFEANWLTPDFAGIRPKLSGPGEGFRDFSITEESALGLAGLVNCIGIESPGLTASSAIAERVVELLAPTFD
jgi:L-2-hydroxyglutarate oxidase LhgO